MMIKRTNLERAMETRLKQVGIEYETEYRFHPTRKWRFDFAFPVYKVALEIEGGSYIRPVKCHICGTQVLRRLKDGRMLPVYEGGGHHSSVFEQNAEKYNEAAILGWFVIRVTSDMVNDDRAVDFVERAIKEREVF